MGDPTQRLFQTSPIDFPVPNPTPAISLVLDSLGEMPLLRTPVPFYMQLSVARLLLLVHGTSIINLVLHGVKISESKSGKFAFSELQRRLTYKANKTSIQRLSLQQIVDRYMVHSVAIEVKYSLQRLELWYCEAAFVSQGSYQPSIH